MCIFVHYALFKSSNSRINLLLKLIESLVTIKVDLSELLITELGLLDSPIR